MHSGGIRALRSVKRPGSSHQPLVRGVRSRRCGQDPSEPSSVKNSDSPRRDGAFSLGANLYLKCAVRPVIAARPTSLSRHLSTQSSRFYVNHRIQMAPLVARDSHTGHPQRLRRRPSRWPVPRDADALRSRPARALRERGAAITPVRSHPYRTRARLRVDWRLLELASWPPRVDRRALGPAACRPPLGAAPLGAWSGRLAAAPRALGPAALS